MPKQTIHPVAIFARIKAEMAADKKRAAILIVLTLVAAVVVVRLLVKSVPESSEAAVSSPAATTAAPKPARPDPLRTSKSIERNDLQEYVNATSREIERDLFRPNPQYFPRKTKGATKVKFSQSTEERDQQARKEAVKAIAQTLSLQSTMLSDTPIAIINDEVLRTGQTIHGLKVVAIGSHSCTLAQDDIEVTLSLKDE